MWPEGHNSADPCLSFKVIIQRLWVWWLQKERKPSEHWLGAPPLAGNPSVVDFPVKYPARAFSLVSPAVPRVLVLGTAPAADVGPSVGLFLLPTKHTLWLGVCRGMQQHRLPRGKDAF